MKLIKKMFRCLRRGWHGRRRQPSLYAYQTGLHLYNLSRYPDAIRYLELIVSDKIPSSPLQKKLAGFYCCRAHINIGITCFAGDDHQAALTHFQKALVLTPDDTDLTYMIGICQQNSGEYGSATKSFTSILETEPFDIPAKLKTSLLLNKLDMWEKVEKIQRNILRKHPRFADVHFHLGLCLMSRGNIKEAVPSFSRALNINPDYVDARLKLSIAHICLKQYHKALANLETIVRKDPGYADVYYLMGRIKEKCNQPEEGIHYLEKALQINPGYQDARARLNRLRCRPGSPDAARDELSLRALRDQCQKDLDIIPNFSEIIAMFSAAGNALKDAGISSVLIPIITEQIKKNPGFPDLYNSLGSQLLLAGKPAEAETAFARAVEINPDYVTARLNLMKTMHRNGKSRDAMEHGLVLASKHLPFPDVYQAINKVRAALGKKDHAAVNAGPPPWHLPTMRNRYSWRPEFT